MSSKILETVKTNFDAKILLGEIEILEKAIYEKIGFSGALSKNIRASTASALEEELGKGETQDSDFLKSLKKQLLGLRSIRLEIGFEPSQAFIRRLSFWVKDNLGQDVVLDFVYSPSLLGGAVIAYNGLYRDLSIRKSLREWFTVSSGGLFKP